MGFYCYFCGRKVRGQPIKHSCTRKRYGGNANRRVYDQSGGKSHRLPPMDKGLICFTLREQGTCTVQNCGYSRNFKRSGLPSPNGQNCINFKKCLNTHPARKNKRKKRNLH